MYPPEYYLEHDKEKIFRVIETRSFATVISRTEDDIIVTHLPLILDRRRGDFGFLVGHMDRNNPHTRYIDEDKVFVVFHGPNAYISPKVYQSSQLPTWNSISVHIKGRIRKTESKEAVRDSMIRMVSFLEKGEDPFVLEKDNQKMQRALAYVVGFEIEIMEMIGRFKLSQNKDAADRRLAKEHLIAASKKGHARLIDFVIDR
jgi:predicted FMN-binding regulatory protein PaiB